MIDTSKIIHAPVGGGRYTVTSPIVKEDYGLYLKIEGLELPSTYEVDFSNSEHNGTSVTMIGNSDGVLIPSQFIASGKDVFAFLYHVGADFGRTVYKFRIPNKCRPDRTNEQPTPEEQSVIDQAISALNSAVEQTAQDKADADVSAQNASADAERAEEARTDAQNYATQAEQSATDAHESASQASASASASANSASQSAQIKADVEDLVDDAQGYAQASAQSATASANSASQALSSAQSATASASSAQGYASQAQTSAQTASTKASEASTSASTASAKATESAQSATSAQGYAQTAEQAKTASQTAQGLAESARDSAISAKNDAEQIKTDVQNIADGIDTRLVDVENDVIKAFPTDTASGSIASFTDGADDLPFKSLVVDINPIQDLSHGDPSPENICPISGWTQVDVEQRGKNLFPNGTDVTVYQTKLIKYDKPIIRKGQTVTISSDVEWGGGYTSSAVFLLRQNDTGITTIYFIGSTRKSTTLTATEDVYGFNFYATDSGAHNTGITTIYRNFQIELGSTATPYEPYAGRSITIDLGQTVYGGKLDVLSGVMTVDRAMVDLGTLSWTKNTETATVQDWRSSDIASLIKAVATNVTPNALCSQFSVMRRTAMDNVPNSIGVTSSGRIGINVPAGAYDSASAFKSVMDGVMLCYELATPIEIQLSPNQVNSLLGVNNIWADSGDTEAVYRADTKLYIAKKIAEAISALS